MIGNNNDKGSNKGIFVNGSQRKFYLIARAFKIVNIIGTIILVLFIGKTLLGI
jgi:hypothetical protein